MAALRPWTRMGWIGLPLLAAGLLFIIDFASSGLYEGAFMGRLISAIAVATFAAGPVFVGWTLMNSYRENGPHNLLGMSLRVWAALIFLGTLLYFLILG